MSSFLRLEKLTKRFKSGSGASPAALDEFSFEFSKNDFAVLLGPSGAGKTTLLRIIAGVETLDSGAIWKGGEKITHIAAVERNTGLVLQSPALLPHLNAWENIALPLKLRKVAKEEVKLRCEKIAAEFGLGNLLKQLPHELSAGEAQRVSLARALIKKPDVLLLDEPLANIDVAGKAELREVISKAAKNRLTIYVTHDQQEAMALAQKIILMRAGKIVEAGSPREIYERPQNVFTAEFVGFPKINLLTRQPWCAVRAEDVMIRDGKTELEATVERIEYFGAEQHIYLLQGNRRLVTRVNGETRFSPGERVFLEIRNVHTFDPRNGRRIENLPASAGC